MRHARKRVSPKQLEFAPHDSARGRPGHLAIVFTLASRRMSTAG